MAKILIEFDTVEKTMAVTRDGAPLPNVVGAYLGKRWDDDDEYRCEVTMSEEDKEHKTRTMTCLVASETDWAVASRTTHPVGTLADDLMAFLAPGTKS